MLCILETHTIEIVCAQQKRRDRGQGRGAAETLLPTKMKANTAEGRWKTNNSCVAPSGESKDADTCKTDIQNKSDGSTDTARQ